MKKISILLCVLFCFSLCSCSYFFQERENVPAFNTETELIIDTETNTESQNLEAQETDTYIEEITSDTFDTEEIITDSDDTEETEVTTEKESETEKLFDFSIAPVDNGDTVIMLDAGHGFDDPGCTSPYLGSYHEKDITLKVVNMIKSELMSQGYSVMLTHDGNSFPSEASIEESAQKYGIVYKPNKFFYNNIFSAYERTIYTDILCIENDLDLFVSIHVNSNPDTDTATGFSIDYCAENPFSSLSKKLMEDVSAQLRIDFPDNKMVHFADSWEDSLIVTKYTLMPSILVEMGFASTKSDAENIINEEWQQKFAVSVANGIISYLNSLD